ncbi:MAG: hypothetical protein L0J45_06680 [Psychroflexus sp.]|nr:hypothetical protein [Psychroflexus sp.]MDN6309131.1 hypothetical protein [Psychroflexus sp.]
MNNLKKIGPLALRAFLYAIALLVICLIIIKDFANAVVLEDEIIEITQEIFLVLAVLVSLMATKFKGFKTFNYVMAGMLSVHFIREFDFWLNYNIYEYAWQILAILVFIPTVYLMLKKRQFFIDELFKLSKTYGFGIFLSGFLSLHIFSRLFGSKKIWNWLMEPIYNENIAEVNGEKVISLYDFVFPLKTGVQEGVELFAYLWILIGIIEMYITMKHHKNDLNK